MEELVVGTLYSNEEIYKSLMVSNAGGIRLRIQDNAVLRAVILTSIHSFNVIDENPYHDRLEDEILTYTAAGKIGDNSVRKVWLFEFKVHQEPHVIPISMDAIISNQAIVASRADLQRSIRRRDRRFRQSG